MNRLDTLEAQVALAIIIAPDDGFTTAAVRVGMQGRIVALADAVGSRAAGARTAERALDGIARGRGIGGAGALVQVSGPPGQDGATRT